MGYPPRSIVAEPFVSQMETIERVHSEVQRQPSLYYGRRNTFNNNINTMVRSHGTGKPLNKMCHAANLNNHHHANLGMAHNSRFQNLNSNSVQAQNYDVANFGHCNSNFPQNMKYSYYQHQLQNQQQNQHSRNLGTASDFQHQPTLGSYGGSFELHSELLMSNISVSKAQQSSKMNIGNTAISRGFNSSLDGYGMMPKTPQVFPDENLFSSSIGRLGNTGNSSVSMDAKLQENLAAFDPFGGSVHGSLLSPILISSSSMLGSNYSTPSHNIWGNKSNKTMVGDAAVWG